jgi:hypothetical protein
MSPLSSTPWQERVLPRQRTLTVRAKLVWTLTLLVFLSLLPVAGSLVALHRARTAISTILRTGIDPSLLVDDVQLALAQSRLARLDFLFTGEPIRGEDAADAAGFVRILVEGARESWPYSTEEFDRLLILARTYENASREMVALGPPPRPQLVLSHAGQVENARSRFLTLRTQAERARTQQERDVALREARTLLLNLDDTVYITVGPGTPADSLLQAVIRSEARIEDISHAVYAQAIRHLTQQRTGLERALSLTVRNLISIILVALVLALAVAFTAPKWILLPIRRLTRLIHYARTSGPRPSAIPVGKDEVGLLAGFLQEHLEQDREVEETRRRFHRAGVQRIEALAEGGGYYVAGIAPQDHLAFVSRGLRDALGIQALASVALPFDQVWPDPVLLEAVRVFRGEPEEEKTITLSKEPFEGRAATLVRSRTGDRAEAEILVLVKRAESGTAPHDESRPASRRS